MGLRDWISYPGELGDRNMEELVLQTGKIAENLQTVAEAVVDLQCRVARLEDAALKTVDLINRG